MVLSCRGVSPVPRNWSLALPGGIGASSGQSAWASEVAKELQRVAGKVEVRDVGYSRRAAATAEGLM
eukprot:3552806-Pyramimonas_sp.AAC.1